MRQSKHSKKVAEAKAKSRSLINASLLWHFENKSQIDDLQSQIQHQNNENKRIQNRLQIKYNVTSYFNKNEFIKKIEGLHNTVQVLQNELMEKYSEIYSMKKQQELQELELRMEFKEDYEEHIRLMDSMDVGEEMIEEPDHEVFEVLDLTIEKNDRLKENLSVANEIIRKHKWMTNTYRAMIK